MVYLRMSLHVPNIIRVIKQRRYRREGYVARMREKFNAYKILMDKTKGKRPFESPTCRLEDNIQIDLQEINRGLK